MNQAWPGLDSGRAKVLFHGSRGSVFLSQGLASLLMSLQIPSPPSPPCFVTTEADLCAPCLWLSSRFRQRASWHEKSGQEQRQSGVSIPLAPSLWGHQRLAESLYQETPKDILSGGRPHTNPPLQVPIITLRDPSDLTQRSYRRGHCIFGSPHSGYLLKTVPLLNSPTVNLT